MNKPLVKRMIPQALVLTAALGLSANYSLAQDANAPAQNSGAPSSGPRSDGQIEMAVVQALDGSEALKNDLITAATIQSQVTLAGTVSSDASRQLAESIAAKVPGVTKVNNNLKVGNPADAQDDQGAPDPNAQDSGQPAMDDNQQQPANPPQDAQDGSAPPQQQNAPQQGYPQQGNVPQQGYPQQGNVPQQGY